MGHIETRQGGDKVKKNILHLLQTEFTLTLLKSGKQPVNHL